MSMTPAEKVKFFTEESGQIQCPQTPQPLDDVAVRFITRMVMSELHELACTVTNTSEEGYTLLQQSLSAIDYHNQESRSEGGGEVIADQADAFVDIWYYILNTAAKHGINLSTLFDIVHQANMNKRDPATGRFIRRKEDQKILKPANWSPPDIVGEIQRQMKEGSWN